MCVKRCVINEVMKNWPFWRHFLKHRTRLIKMLFLIFTVLNIFLSHINYWYIYGLRDLEKGQEWGTDLCEKFKFIKYSHSKFNKVMPGTHSFPYPQSNKVILRAPPPEKFAWSAHGLPYKIPPRIFTGLTGMTLREEFKFT